MRLAKASSDVEDIELSTVKNMMDHQFVKKYVEPNFFENLAKME